MRGSVPAAPTTTAIAAAAAVLVGHKLVVVLQDNRVEDVVRFGRQRVLHSKLVGNIRRVVVTVDHHCNGVQAQESG